MAPNIVKAYLYAFINWLIDCLKRVACYFNLHTDKQNVEDIYLQLIRTKSFDEAEKLALQHKFLDLDIVHQCRWRSSGVTVQSIHSILGRVQDKLWSINECVDTVPISYEACKTLIEFGLKEASLKLLYQLGHEDSLDESRRDNDRSEKKPKQSKKKPALPDDISDAELEGLIDFDHLNKRQKELCRCRLDLLHHEHTLLAYESILGDYRTIQQHFDHVFYEEFRRKSPLNVCIDYAHDGDSHAVEMLLNFFTEQLSPHLLAILSNLPETLSPYLYRNLVPCMREDEPTFEWQVLTGQIKKEEFDWCNRGVGYSAFLNKLRQDSETFEKEFYEENAHLKKYLKPLDSDTLTQWYIERALEIESRTLLMTSAIQLLNLGIELNIKNLKDTCDDLVEFDRILYDCCSELDIYLSFSDFKSKTELERLILMTGDSVKNCKDRFRFFVIPYLHRRESKYSIEDKAAILEKYFEELAHKKQNICNVLYSDLLDSIEYDNLVADWTKGLDDVIDGIGDKIKAIERQRQSKELSMLASQTYKLGSYEECYETCQIIMEKNHREHWAQCCTLGMEKRFANLEARYKLLAFALAHCDDPDGRTSAKMLEHVIELRKRDEKLQIAYLESNMCD